MVILIKTLQLLLSLSILVIIHEFGHFTFARLFKTRVEKFYLFFNPWFSLFKMKKGETEYGIGWLPLGGYVKISGMIDESMDKEQMKQPPQPWEFRSKKPWQRLFIMIGGVLFNLILAALIYIAVLYTWGMDYVPVENMKYGITTNETGEQIGFQNGDKIISINKQKFERFKDIQKEILLSDQKTVQIERNGKPLDILITDDDIKSIIKSKSTFLGIRTEFVIDSVLENSNASKAGIKKGDKFISVNDSSLQFFDEFVHFFKSNKNSQAKVSVLRGGNEISMNVNIDSLGMIGVASQQLAGIEMKHKDFSFFESIPAGISLGGEQLKDYIRQFKLIFNPQTEAYKSLGSFGAIGSMFAPVWDWESFWNLTALISIILAVVNLLPIPALDGGHVMFVLYEMITGRKPSDKFMEYAQIVGLVIILAIFVFAIRNDIVNFLM